MFFVFFFKQKTAYEMRISDWSSDVCSSDLLGQEAGRRLLLEHSLRHLLSQLVRQISDLQADDSILDLTQAIHPVDLAALVNRQVLGGRLRGGHQLVGDRLVGNNFAAQRYLLLKRMNHHGVDARDNRRERKSTRLNSSH